MHLDALLASFTLTNLARADLAGSYFTWCDRLFGSDVCWQHARKIEASGKSWVEAVEMASTFASEKAKADKAAKAQ